MRSGAAILTLLLAAHGCSEAIFAGIGPGGLRHLDERGIRGWLGPEGVAASELVARHARGEQVVEDLATAQNQTAGLLRRIWVVENLADAALLPIAEEGEGR